MHISMLERSQTGLGCGCLCAGCGGTVEAVNAGRDAEYFLRPKARGQFFRYAAGQQKDACLIKAALLAALHLLAERDEIELPAHVVRRDYLGGSGNTYSGSASSQPLNEVIQIDFMAQLSLGAD